MQRYKKKLNAEIESAEKNDFAYKNAQKTRFCPRAFVCVKNILYLCAENV